MEKFRRNILKESTLNICLENKDQILAFFSVSEVESLMFSTRMIMDMGVSGKCTSCISTHNAILLVLFTTHTISHLYSGGSLVRGADAYNDTMETQT